MKTIIRVDKVKLQSNIGHKKIIDKVEKRFLDKTITKEVVDDLSKMLKVVHKNIDKDLVD